MTLLPLRTREQLRKAFSDSMSEAEHNKRLYKSGGVRRQLGQPLMARSELPIDPGLRKVIAALVFRNGLAIHDSAGLRIDADAIE